jgi:hypothetical protein
VQVAGCDADLAEERRRQVPLREAEALALSFRRLARVSNLGGLDGLTKLQLDNNRIERIEGIAHLVRARARAPGAGRGGSSGRGRQRLVGAQPKGFRRAVRLARCAVLSGGALEAGCQARGLRGAPEVP